jgi:DNA-binding beta-propeller fold protein YncE
MSLRKLFLLSMVAALCLGRPAFSQMNKVKIAGGGTAEVIQGKSPAVQVTDAEGKILASIPIEKDPGKFIYSEFANTLYVVHDEKKGEHFISAVNLTTNLVDKKIKVGAGVNISLNMMNGGRRLFCYTGGKESNVWASGDALRRYRPPFEPSTSVIDTASNDLITTYNWFDGLRKSVKIEGNRQIFFLPLYSDEETSIVELHFNYAPLNNQAFSAFVIYSGHSSSPVIAIDPGGRIIGSMLSKDNKFLIAIVKGDKNTHGTLAVVDFENRKVVHHAMTEDPKTLLRLGSNQELWTFGSKEMCSVSETGELCERRIPLNKTRVKEESGKNETSDFQDAILGETIALGDDRVAIMISNKHKVALIDMKKLQVDAIIPTMSTGEKFGIEASRIATAVVLTAATGGTVMFTPNLTLSNQILVARPDAQFLYTLDLDDHKVTVIDVQTAKVVRHISVNESVIKIQVSPDGKFLVCTGKKTRQNINLETYDFEEFEK